MSTSPGKRKASQSAARPLLRFLIWGSLLLVILLGAVAGYGYVWVQRYLQSEDFRHQLAQQLGDALQSEADLPSLDLTGAGVHASTVRLVPLKPSGWSKVEADRVDATVDWNRLRDQVVQIPRVQVDWLGLQLGAEPDQTLRTSGKSVRQVQPAPGWIKAWLPQRTEIEEILVNKFDLQPATAGGVSIRGLELKAKPSTTSGAWQLHGTQGTLTLPFSQTPFRITSATARADAQSLVLNDLGSRWLGNSEITARGEVPFRSGAGWQFSGTYSSLALADLLSEQWRQRLSGVLRGEYQVNASTQKTHVIWTGGVVQNLPLLDRVADFTNTARFRRVVLDEAHADIEQSAERTAITNLVLQSNGLIRVEGTVTLRQGQVQGTLQVGVSPETLKWMPGSRSRVFTETRADLPGFVWTTVQLSGSLERPQEDLSNRLLAAMGKALILDAPLGAVEAGAGLLEQVGAPGTGAVKDGVRTGGALIEGAGDAAGKVIKDGAEIIRDVVPIPVPVPFFGN